MTKQSPFAVLGAECSDKTIYAFSDGDAFFVRTGHFPLWQCYRWPGIPETAKPKSQKQIQFCGLSCHYRIGRHGIVKGWSKPNFANLKTILS
ncbi:hypothetical protein [Methyloglobulus morosus]|uniref:hypothetical protein n=1 Tax=Methyloglobulus morosus TaxID=1410681 RepID=UPI00128F26A4|nr:hypothetical protein [Methyloglobulus morosus]